LRDSDGSSSTTTTPPATQGNRELDADGDGETYSNPWHEPQNVSPKPRRDGADRERLKVRRMATKHKVTVSAGPTHSRGTTAERRAAQVAALSTQQAELKQEAAERRAERGDQNGPAAKAAAARRSI
jgi:hypothetical protein